MKTIFTLVFLVGIACQSAFGQMDSNANPDDRPAAQLLDEWSKSMGSEDRSARYDGFMNMVLADPGNKAVFVFYCGKECYYGEFEAHIRGIVTMKLDDWKIDRDRIVFIQGGYRDETVIRVWVVPQGADFPTPEPTVKFEDVKFKGVYKKTIEVYDCCGEI